MPKPPEIKVSKVNNPETLQKVFGIRREVFVVEQHCPPDLEWEHEEESHHFLATVDSEPAGACRWRKTDSGYKLERFAVLKPFIDYHALFGCRCLDLWHP
jgi:predicted GNAT family N-acyltransferase